mgnify:CR=1 FL=1
MRSYLNRINDKLNKLKEKHLTDCVKLVKKILNKHAAKMKLEPVKTSIQPESTTTLPETSEKKSPSPEK